MSEFKTVGVIGKPRSAAMAPLLRALHAHLRRRGCEVLVERETARLLGGRIRAVAREQLARHAELAVVLGGDGTLLNAGRSLAPAGVPILGVNQGRLGFMVDIAPDDMKATLDRVLEGRYVRERRLMLSAVVRRASGREQRPFLAINDVVLRHSTAVRMLEFETWLDDEFISRHRADGLIVSTPTGSTAYALSGGGPVLHPALEAVALVPICPHALSDRPVVVSCDRAVRLVLGGVRGTRAQCTADGQHSEMLAVGDSVIITRSDHVLELIHPENYQYFNILRTKLQWGRERASGRR